MIRKIVFISFVALITLCTTTSCKNDKSAAESGIKASPPTTYKGERIIKDVGINEARALMEKEKDLVILDIRTPEETKQGKIKGAIEIDFTADDFEVKIANLDKNVPYLVYCKGGGRSTQCKNYMETLGFPRIYHLNRGYDSWPKFE